MYSIFVTLRVKEDYAEAFVRASFGDSVGSIKNEPNCYRFDVLRNSNDLNLFHLYEVYKDEYSHKELHLNMPHFLKWQEEVLPMLDGDPSSVVMDTIFPDDQVWENQKNSLLKAE